MAKGNKQINASPTTVFLSNWWCSFLMTKVTNSKKISPIAIAGAGEFNHTG